MKLPNRERAYVPEQKLTAYLLSLSHPVGKSKARFFRNMGFDLSNVEWLQAALIDLARRANVEETEHTPYGTKYALTGSLDTPEGGSVAVRTVWIVEEPDSAPRFVTAYPA